MKKNYKRYNAENVLMRLEHLIEQLEERRDKETDSYWRRRVSTVRTREVCEELSIFDWWKDDMSLSKLYDMRKFLREAIKLGYKGYVCFKVGATGCANGMWAHKKESENGYSPKGACIYKSFTPAYNYWQVCTEEEIWYPRNNEFETVDPTDLKYDALTTARKFETYLKERF